MPEKLEIVGGLGECLSKSDEVLSLQEVQMVSLGILKVIDGICRAEGLRYWLWYGSLLGAVRHQGFIPWDDDLDIAMPRKDYEKLLEYFWEHEADLRPLVLINKRCRPETPFLITRISDTDYKMIGEYGDFIPELGAFVDVYPFDGAGSDYVEANRVKASAHELIKSYLRASNYDYFNRENPPLKNAAKTILSRMLGNPEKYLVRLEELIKQHEFEDSAFVEALCWVESLKRPVIDKAYLAEEMLVDFEDFLAPIPVGFDGLLTHLYGSYMELPAENLRIPHHEYMIVKRHSCGSI